MSINEDKYSFLEFMYKANLFWIMVFTATFFCILTLGMVKNNPFANWVDKNYPLPGGTIK